jgi:3-oxoacyl-[acyl-carrier protein] reductase
MPSSSPHAPYLADLAGQAAIVTGASRGIGRAIALMLARGGAAVVAAARNAEHLASLVDEIERAGGKALAVLTDMASDADVAALVPVAVAHFGKLDILVNNAGIGIYGPMERATNDEWDLVMRVNARAPFILCREAIPHLRRAGGGTIVNIASVVAIKGYANQAIYGASKHAMMGWSKVLAQEVQKDNIRVHTICPGGVATDLVSQARPDLDRSILMTPEEVAEVVRFLVTFKGNAVIDDVHLRRASGEPWF